jgi:hypothetical protein
MAPPIAARRLTNFPASRRSASTAQSPKSTTPTKIFMSARAQEDLFTDDLLNVIKDSILVRQVKSGMKIPRSLGKGARLCMRLPPACLKGRGGKKEKSSIGCNVT